MVAWSLSLPRRDWSVRVAELAAEASALLRHVEDEAAPASAPRSGGPVPPDNWNPPALAAPSANAGDDEDEALEDDAPGEAEVRP